MYFNFQKTKDFPELLYIIPFVHSYYGIEHFVFGYNKQKI